MGDWGMMMIFQEKLPCLGNSWHALRVRYQTSLVKHSLPCTWLIARALFFSALASHFTYSRNIQSPLRETLKLQAFVLLLCLNADLTLLPFFSNTLILWLFPPLEAHYLAWKTCTKLTSLLLKYAILHSASSSVRHNTMGSPLLSLFQINPCHCRWRLSKFTSWFAGVPQIFSSTKTCCCKGKVKLLKFAKQQEIHFFNGENSNLQF